MKAWRVVSLLLASLLVGNAAQAADEAAPLQVVQFPSGALTLGGELYKPVGPGPFPAVLYNHGSAGGMLNSQAAKAIGPLFAAQGWVFFMPYRRGQGLSAQAGAFIGDEIAQAQRAGGLPEAARVLVQRMGNEQLQDQLAGLQWLRAQPFVAPGLVATAGNSFGGIQALLGAANAPYCAAIDASGGAESWRDAPALQGLMKDAARRAQAPVFFFQAENDFDLAPTRELLAEMQRAGKPADAKIYPPFGRTAREGHSFAYAGATTWFPEVFAFIQKHCAR